MTSRRADTHFYIPCSRFARILALALPALAIAISAQVFATTFNSPTLDGTVSVSPEDWDADELLLSDSPNDARYPEADISDIYVTWDETYLYIGVKTSRPPGGFGDGYIVFIDKDAEAASITGATDFTRANFYPRRLTFTGMGADVMIAGWSLGKPYEVRDCSDPTKTKALSGAAAEPNAALLSYEARIPWAGMYPNSATPVPAGAKLRIVAATVGGDNSGAYDAAPNSSHDSNGNGKPDESDPATPWDAYTDLDRFLEISLDYNLDGVPDQGYPFAGGFSGTVILNDQADTQTAARVDAFLGSTLYASAEAPRGGGEYRLPRVPDGMYDLEAYANSYRKVRKTGVAVAGAVVPGIDFYLIKVAGAVMGTVDVEGPPSDVTVFVADAVTGAVGGDGAKVIGGGTGSFKILTVEDGDYNLVAEARGYVRQSHAISVSGDTVRVNLVLEKAIATRYVFVDDAGAAIYAERISRSIPSADIFDYADLRFEPRDAEGNAAIFDDASTDSVRLAATLLDAAVGTRGNVLFTDSLGVPIPGDLLTRSYFKAGVGRFLVSDDSVEVVLVEVGRGNLRGTVEVGVGELKPARVGLAVSESQIKVGERADLDVQLLDASGNPTPTAGVGVRLETLEGAPSFGPEVAVTDANGSARVSLMSLKAGTARFTAEVEPGEFAGLPSDTVSVDFTAEAAYEITAAIRPKAVRAGGEAQVSFQVVDRYGNPVAETDVRIDLVAEPAGLLASMETPVFTDADGMAASTILAGPRYGLVSIEAASKHPVAAKDLAIDPRLASIDEAAPESDPAHNSDPNVDLTTVFAWLEAETLKVSLDFASVWDGVHLMVVLEVDHDAAGSDQDPFQFPIFYRHPNRPDLVFTYKYSSNDYADLRHWNGSRWEYWQLASGAWTTDDADPGKNAVAMVKKAESEVTFAFPLSAVGALAAGSAISLEAYVAQESFGTKYTALDSSPRDDTQDMIPAEGNWYDTATNPRNLSKYADYAFPVAGAAPAATDGKVTPGTASPGDRVTLEVTVADQGGGIGDVLADLSTIGGDATTRLFDLGTDGDQTAGDGVFTTRFTIPGNVPQGIRNIVLTAKDSLNVSESTDTASVVIVNPPEVIISAADSVGDDHGPNHTKGGVPVEGLYYYYPTNGVFAPGCFDIEKAELMIDGSFLVIRVYLGEVPSSEAVGWNAPYPGETCTNPNKADLNLQKVDVYIDTKEGAGATRGLPFRYVDIARSDGWEFAAVSEGWWKGLIESNGQNSTASWTIRRLADQIDFCDDYVENTIDVRIGLDVLGNPTPETVQEWDFIITVSGHDGDSNDQNLGGTRWVNQATSEWQFGGGRDSEAGRERDANIIDVLTVPGEDKVPGRTQEEMLDYSLTDATRRFNDGETACIIEATSSKDVSPPRIQAFATDGFAHAPWYVLEDAPASFWTKVEDESDVDSVWFYWRPLGEAVWRAMPMVNIAETYWIADIDPDTLRQDVRVVELVDGTPARPFEARIRARDQYGNQAETPLLTFAVPEQNLEYETATGVTAGTTAILYDGTILMVPAQHGAPEFDSYDFKITPIAPGVPAEVDFADVRSSQTYLGVARRLEITGHKGGEAGSVDVLENPITLVLHYPSYIEAKSRDENTIGLFEYNDVTSRWIGLFGQANWRGNAVLAEVRRAGIYGLFADRDLKFDSREGLSGVRAEPNPFSPNGDGIYDETSISFFLARDADWVTVEIFDVAGAAVRTIRWQQGLTTTGRNAFEIIWDGKDDHGEVVPYGIYVLRVEARFKVAPYNERQNIGVAVIK